VGRQTKRKKQDRQGEITRGWYSVFDARVVGKDFSMVARVTCETGCEGQECGRWWTRWIGLFGFLWWAVQQLQITYLGKRKWLGGNCKRGWRWSPLTTKGRAHWDHLLLGTAIAMGRSPQGKCSLLVTALFKHYKRRLAETTPEMGSYQGLLLEHSSVGL